MDGLSNALVGILNFLTFLLSLPILAVGIWLRSKAGTDCERFLDTPLIALGAFLLVISFAGFVGACCRNSFLLWLYLFVMFALLVLLFAFVVTNKGAGEVVSGRRFKEYRLGDYSNWIQNRVGKPENWMKIRSCLQESKVCQSMVIGVDQEASQFYAQNLSPIQSLSTRMSVSFFCKTKETPCKMAQASASSAEVQPTFFANHHFSRVI